MDKLYKQHLIHLKNTKKLRRLQVIKPSTNKAYIDFSTNDYLNLSNSPQLLDAALQAAKKYGVGSTGSRLLSGNSDLHVLLEDKIAHNKQTQAALAFVSGFQTNSSVLAGLLDHKILGTRPLVFFDKLNHSSLYQGVLLSGAKLIRYKHNDLDHLTTLLTKYADDVTPKFIVTETVFGMDGDVIAIDKIAALAEKNRTFLYLDEAHATGVFGNNGYGLSTTVNLTKIPHLIMGTFSKALGCNGGYVACSQIVKDFLVNKAAGFIYSTANSPLLIGAAIKAWEMVKDFNTQREQLFLLSSILREQLKRLGFNIGNTSTNIIPIIFGKEELASHAQEKLLKNGIIVSCIRPPSVPNNTSRIRIALNIGHQHDDLDTLIKNLKNL